jgi:hypothetical protein
MIREIFRITLNFSLILPQSECAGTAVTLGEHMPGIMM